MSCIHACVAEHVGTHILGFFMTIQRFAILIKLAVGHVREIDIA